MSTATRQQYLTTSKVRLLVERDPTGTELVNQLANSDGAQGGFGWSTPVAGTTMSGNPVDGLAFYNGNLGVTASFLSQPIYVKANQWIAAQWTELPGDNGHRARFAFFTDAGAQISATTESAYYKATTSTTRSYAAVQAPAGTSYARLRINMYSNNSNAVPTLGARIRFTNAIISYATTSGALSTIATAQQSYWTDVLPSTQSISVNRTALNLGTLTARILSTTLDPWFDTTLRPGRRVRLEAFNDVGLGWQPLFVGRTGKPKVQNLFKTSGQRIPSITMTAYDAVASLAGTRYANGYSNTLYLTAALEACVVPVPWAFNGVQDQFDVVGPDAVDVNATVLDQVIRTRDTNFGAAWVDRYGVLRVTDPAYMTTGVADTITDTDYNDDAVIDWDIDKAINTLSITNLVDATSTTTTARDPGSVSRWGELPASYTVIDVDAAWPQKVLQGDTGFGGPAAGSTEPVLMVRSITVPMGTAADVNRFIKRDLWDLVTVTCTDPAISANYRIASITHTFQARPGSYADSWHTTYGLALPGRAPIPTV